MILFCLNFTDTMNRTLCRSLLAFIVVSTTALAAGAETSPSVHSRTLSNGLEIFVKVDRRAPVAVSMMWYRAGSIDETSGTTGVAHVLEHMMFQGTRRIPGAEFSTSTIDHCVASLSVRAQKNRNHAKPVLILLLTGRRRRIRWRP